MAAPGSDLNAPARPSRSTPGRGRWLRAAGIVVGLLAVGFCGWTLMAEWSTVRAAVSAADPAVVTAAAVGGLAGTICVAEQWRWMLGALGAPTGRRRAWTWFFAGELCKYVPGGVWAVVGRGELAHRGGVPRAVAYPATLLSLGVFCLSGGIGWAALYPFTGLARWWTVLLIPVLLTVVHPAVLRPVFAILGRVSRGRLIVPVLPWPRMLGLVGVTLPGWLLLGATSALVAASLGLTADPVAVAGAAIAAWVVGVLVPVPAGAGIREVAFAVGSGLPAGPAILVAALARVVFVVVDLATGLLALTLLRRTGAPPRPVVPAPPD